MIILEIILSWSLYYFMHSLLASFYVKSKVEKLSPGLFKYYRLFYNILSSFLLVLLYKWSESFEHIHLIEKSTWIVVLAYSFLLPGMILLFLSFRNYDKREFLGLSVKQNDKAQLSTGGLNAYFRHPLYIGTILLLVGFFLLNPHVNRLVYVLVSLLYLPIGSKLEENKLKIVFGKQYEDYLKKVKF